MAARRRFTYDKAHWNLQVHTINDTYDGTFVAALISNEDEVTVSILSATSSTSIVSYDTRTPLESGLHSHPCHYNLVIDV